MGLGTPGWARGTWLPPAALGKVRGATRQQEEPREAGDAVTLPPCPARPPKQAPRSKPGPRKPPGDALRNKNLHPLQPATARVPPPPNKYQNYALSSVAATEAPPDALTTAAAGPEPLSDGDVQAAAPLPWDHGDTTAGCHPRGTGESLWPTSQGSCTQPGRGTTCSSQHHSGRDFCHGPPREPPGVLSHRGARGSWLTAVL